MLIHRSPFRGVWYPEDAGELEAQLQSHFAGSERRTGSFLFPGGLGYVVPHAGPSYSGTVAAAVYRALRAAGPQRIVLLGFPHRGGLSGVVATDAGAISTPLGDVVLDGEFGGFARAPEAEVCDHSCEIQLPFLQQAAPHARLTVLYVGRMSAAERQSAAERLAAAWRPGTIFLASSDFTHYGRGFAYQPFPADEVVADRLRELDTSCFEAAGSLDAALFLETIAARRSNACGTGPIALLLATLRALRNGDLYQAVLDYQTSGEITGDFVHSVSYGALGYFPASSFALPEPDCVALLDAARRTLDELRRTGARGAAPAHGSSALAARRGAFVSLHQGAELLGCVGNCAGRRPLAEEIGELTLSAALDDPRFLPAARQAGPIDIEISLLTPFRRIRDTAEFRVGQHGAMLSLGGRRGLLLPQVAEAREWSSADFLRALARKSGLAPGDWAHPHARLEIFEAQIFARRG